MKYSGGGSKKWFTEFFAIDICLAFLKSPAFLESPGTNQRGVRSRSQKLILSNKFEICIQTVIFSSKIFDFITFDFVNFNCSMLILKYTREDQMDLTVHRLTAND